MAGHKPWSDLRKKMTPAQRALADDLYRQKKLGLLVAEMRKSAGLTQVQLAEKLGIGQSSLSQMENGDDMHFGTLERIVAELGGKIVVHLPGGDIPLSTAPY